MKVAIIGAGIGGLTAAAYLACDAHSVTVFDQFDTPRPVGSGLVIQPVGQQVLDEIGGAPAAMAAGARITRMLGHEAKSGRPVLDVSYDRGGDHAFGLSIHRASLFDAVLAAAQAAGALIIANARVLSAQSGVVRFENGDSDGPFDLIMDASGASSPLSPIKARAALWGGLGLCRLARRHRPAARSIAPNLSSRQPHDRRHAHRHIARRHPSKGRRVLVHATRRAFPVGPERG